ncbi:MAG: AbrB family transcriptional regulator [Gammaproteobacteria bacterium]|nr:AbrB family transcriptional regulator [Gammaproteobacteria bacterium]
MHLRQPCARIALRGRTQIPQETVEFSQPYNELTHRRLPGRWRGDLAAALSLTGFINHRPPAEIIWAAQFFIGLAVGVKYAGVTVTELRRYVVAGLVYSVLLAELSILFFMAVRALVLAPSLEALLAFLPGGQAEMVVVAIIAGADLAFVVSHHLMRLVFVILFAPVAARLFADP